MIFCFENAIKIKTFEKLNCMKIQEARTFDVVDYFRKTTTLKTKQLKRTLQA